MSENDANGSPYEGQFATSLYVACLKDADDVCKWGRRRWDIESSFHVEKNGGYGLGHNFCNKSRVSRNSYLLMQIAHNLWQLFNSTCLLPLQKKRKNRNMTQRKWAAFVIRVWPQGHLTASTVFDIIHVHSIWIGLTSAARTVRKRKEIKCRR